MEIIDRASARASVQPADDDGFYDDVLVDGRMGSVEDECPECMLAYVIVGTLCGLAGGAILAWLP